MELAVGAFGILFAIIFLAPFIVVPIVILTIARKAFRFQSKVFQSIEPSLMQKIEQAERPNRHYVKTRCDNCGARCSDASDTSPSGDLKCEYCGTWFNVLRG